MSLEYAPRGLVGMLTPQANTTVEPEFNLLWPRGRGDDQRAADERQGVDDRTGWSTTSTTTARRCGSSPTRRWAWSAAACTGASYLAGREREAAVVRGDRGAAAVIRSSPRRWRWSMR